MPSAAVKTDNGTKYVLVVDGRRRHAAKTVTVGVSDDTYTEITSGSPRARSCPPAADDGGHHELVGQPGARVAAFVMGGPGGRRRPPGGN